MRPAAPAFVIDILGAVLLLAAVVAAVWLLSGCQWARVRYVDRAAHEAELLVCQVEANDLVCRDYHAANKQDGVQVVPANSAERVDM